eukprot:c12905_g1_i3.p1 GENE.c12905_g1_i3~~c12905_g1_i3.p1  ORF type:complete len:261 (+),score=43.21 c12905_g1_i3:19-801(+)
MGFESFTYRLFWRPALITTGVCGVSCFAAYNFKIPRSKPFVPNRDSTTLLGRAEHWLANTDKTVLTIMGANVAVFVMWKFPKLHNFMLRNFLHFSLTGLSRQLFLANISHSSFLHFALNMYTFQSFSEIIIDRLGPEKFLAGYLTAGGLSSLVFHAYSLYRKQNIAVLGASGGILALVAVVCEWYPDVKVQIFFIPYDLTLRTVLMAVVAFDVAGVLLGWKVIGHVSHLAGVALGIGYVEASKALENYRAEARRSRRKRV